jgi:tyrosyl-tRNA synthetase
MKIITDEKKIEEILTRGVENIYPNREFLEKALKSGKELTIYMGIDPTGDLHIGHSIPLRKLREFQDLGHHIIVLIGDFTAQIGDPTDKTATRKKLTRKQVLENAKDYKKLVGTILDLKKSNIRFLHNEKWSNKLKPIDMLELASHFTVQRLIERDMFQERIKQGKEIYLHEFLYPIFQAYDSVTMNVDGEIGGNDQMFNMLAGRTLMKKMKDKEKFVITTKLLEDPTGKKMGKTEGNIIALKDSAEEIFGKVMSWNDAMIIMGFELCTKLTMAEIRELENELKAGANPRDLKMRLAREIVTMYHSDAEAKQAEENFIKLFQKKERPEEIAEIKPSSYDILTVLAESKIAKSKSDARRLIEQGGVKVNNQKIDSIEMKVKAGDVVQKGSRFFVKIAN